jgi:hypothetical protein
MADQSTEQLGKGVVQLSGTRPAARPRLATLEKLPTSNRVYDRVRIHQHFEEAIEAEADKTIGNFPRFRIAMEKSSMSLPYLESTTEVPRPLTTDELGKTFMKYQPIF